MARRWASPFTTANIAGGKDLGKAFKYADTRHARCVAVMGQDEHARGEVKIKDMTTGAQQAVSRDGHALRDYIATLRAPGTVNPEP